MYSGMIPPPSGGFFDSFVLGRLRRLGQAFGRGFGRRRESPVSNRFEPRLPGGQYCERIHTVRQRRTDRDIA
jgi:hypothetical protein